MDDGNIIFGNRKNEINGLSTEGYQSNNRTFLRNLFIVNYVILTCSAQLEFFPLDDNSSISNNYNILSDEVQVECFSTVYFF